MDLDQVWKDAIANVISKFTDLKDMSVVKCIETMCSFEVSGNNIVFICNNDMASKMLPMYVSQLFIEITNLMGVSNYGLQMVMAGSRPNQSQSQSVGSTQFGNSHYPQQQNQYLNDNYQNSSNAGVPVSGQSQSVGSTLLGNTRYTQQQNQYTNDNYQSSSNAGIPVSGMNSQYSYSSANQQSVNSQPSFNAQHNAGFKSFMGQQNPNIVPRARITDNIDPKKTFDNYITDPENKLPIAAAMRIAETPGSDNFNPFYIYGGSGLGKTHILWAIANKIRETKPNVSVIYIRAEDFIRRYVDSMSQKSSFAPQQVHFQDMFTQYDVFIMDDIQSLTKGDKARDTFFDIIANFLDIKGKQLILASDVAPGNLKNFNDRLVTRFGSGICSEIYPPSSETRTAIILRKCKELNFELPNSVVDYIATNIRSSVREIEGAIKTLKNLVQVNGGTVTYDEAVKILSSSVNKTSNNTTVDSIKDRVAKEFEVTVESLESASRKKNISQARSFAIALTHELIPTLSSSDIGRSFNKDHSSVLAAIARVEEWKVKDKDMNVLYQKLVLSLKKN